MTRWPVYVVVALLVLADTTAFVAGASGASGASGTRPSAPVAAHLARAYGARLVRHHVFAAYDLIGCDRLRRMYLCWVALYDDDTRASGEVCGGTAWTDARGKNRWTGCPILARDP